MMTVETIYTCKFCNSQLVSIGTESLFCGICNPGVRPDEIKEVDNSPIPFAG